MSGCIIFIHKDLHITEVQQEVLVGCLSFISFLGSIAAGRTLDIIGRKWTIGLAAAVFQAGAAIMACAPSFAALMAGRLLGGSRDHGRAGVHLGDHPGDAAGLHGVVPGDAHQLGIVRICV
jgi:MFS family permease